MPNRTLFLDSTSVDSYLEGFVQSNVGVQLDPKRRVVVRSDIESVRSSKVTLLSGGGSGHEPSHAGFVGKGMLSAAVAGDIFTSPSVASILSGLPRIKGPAGILVIVKNYTGDRLNFGLAIEQFRVESPETLVEMVLVADDLATKDASAGARGLCGTIIYHKILGAMAEAGENLESLIQAASILKDNIVTLSAAVGHCQVPGNVLADFPNDTYEVGLGIHNEPGAERKPVQALSAVISDLLQPLFDALQPHPEKEYFILVNNLGGLSEMELGNVKHCVTQWTKERSIRIKGIASGTFMTSLNMPGFSITIANLPLVLSTHLLNPEHDCRVWPNFSAISESSLLSNEQHLSQILPLSGQPSVSENFQRLAKEAVKRACSEIIKSKSQLNELDAISGDGDCGSSLSSLASEILAASPTLVYGHPAHLFYQLSKIAEKTGGTSGALYGILFGTLSRNLTTPKTVGCWSSAFENAVSKLAFYSGASVGQKCMLDVLVPVQELLKKIPGDSGFDDLKGHMDNIKAECKRSVEATSQMKARVGRASYSSKRSDITGHPDPGAVAVSIWITQIAETIQES